MREEEPSPDVLQEDHGEKFSGGKSTDSPSYLHGNEGEALCERWGHRIQISLAWHQGDFESAKH